MAAKRKALKRRGATKKATGEGEPFQHTELISIPGWYRACVRGSWYQVRRKPTQVFNIRNHSFFESEFGIVQFVIYEVVFI
jgi:hypothetical protein